MFIDLLLAANLWLAQVQPDQPQASVHVIVSLDANRNGTWEDAGPGVYVEARDEDHVVSTNYTDNNSDAAFILTEGVYTFIAYVEPLGRFSCQQVVNVNRVVKYVDLRCIEQVTVHLPFITVPAQVQTAGVEEPAFVVHVVPLWDADYDGKMEGVGPNRVVEARQGGQIVATSLTNQNSDAGFVLGEGFYKFDAWLPQTRFLFVWDCTQTEYIDSPEQYVIIECVERFFLRFPFTLG